MNVVRPRIRKFRIADVNSWAQLGDDELYLQNVVNDAREGQLTIGFGRVGTGVSFESRFPYDEVVVVIRGAVTYQIDGAARTARAGDVAYYPADAPVVGRFDEHTEAVYIICPPHWQLTDSDWESIGSSQVPFAEPPATSQEQARVFGVGQYTLDQMGDLEYYSTAVVDEPGRELSVKFERVGQGVSGEHFFPYEEVHVVLKGILTIRTENETISVEPGEVVHLPMRARAVVQADADVEMVSVTHPPHWHIRAVAT
ncbi:cupin domain-containing protein [Phytoactinopolyspora mesophila]|uniref:cupin domain-containing protein n=1 Tax=Phytoactinopolyspora mesophila TaxID=2650750 RepID=UPI001391E923